VNSCGYKAPHRQNTTEEILKKEDEGKFSGEVSQPQIRSDIHNRTASLGVPPLPYMEIAPPVLNEEGKLSAMCGGCVRV
jgi:hypothetical protein